MRNFLRRLNPIRNKVTLIGYVILVADLFGRFMDAIDFLRIVKMVWQFLPAIGQFLTSGLGTLVVAAVGLITIAVGSTRYEKEKKKNKTSGYRDEAEKLGEILRQMMNVDNARPDQCVVVEPRRIDLAHMKDPGGPYLVFTFSIYNGSVYTLKFGKPPTGHLRCEKQELKDPLEFPPGSLKPTIERTHVANLELRQFLLPELANKMLDTPNMKTKRVSFNFDMVNLPIDAIRPNEESGNTWRCPFPREVSFDWPVSGSVAFPN